VGTAHHSRWSVEKTVGDAHPTRLGIANMGWKPGDDLMIVPADDGFDRITRERRISYYSGRRS
jgi:hypothetical protein